MKWSLRRRTRCTASIKARHYRSASGPHGNVLPDRITIYQQPIVEDTEDDDAVIRAIGETVIHEFGHYFGLSEEEIEAIETRYWRGHADADHE